MLFIAPKSLFAIACYLIFKTWNCQWHGNLCSYQVQGWLCVLNQISQIDDKCKSIEVFGISIIIPIGKL